MTYAFEEYLGGGGDEAAVVQVPDANPGTGGEALTDALKVLVDRHPKSHYSADADPSAGENAADGYRVGSLWINASTDAVFLLVRFDGDDAVWVDLSNTAALEHVVEDTTPELGGDLDAGGHAVTNVGQVDGRDVSADGAALDAHAAAEDNPHNVTAAQAGALADLADDASPQLGGDLDTNGQKVTTAGGADLFLQPDGAGALVALLGGDARGDRAVDWGRARDVDADVASGSDATIGGGKDNAATAQRATVAGGEENRATAAGAAVGGGYANEATGTYASVSGGYNNVASASYSRAGGRDAEARLEAQDAFAVIQNYQRSEFLQHGYVNYNGGVAQEIVAPERLTFENGKTYFVRTTISAGGDPVNGSGAYAVYETLVMQKDDGTLVQLSAPSARGSGSGGGGVTFSVAVDTVTHKALEVSAYAASGEGAYVIVRHEILEAPNGITC